MAFCPNCGTQVEGRFCAKCGAAVGASGSDAGAAAGAQAAASGAQAAASGAQAAASGAQAAAAPASGGMADNVASALSYILFLGVLFLIIEPYNKRKEVRFHAFQGLFLFGATIVFWIAYDIVEAIMTHIFFAIGLLMATLGLIIALGILALWLYLVIRTYQGRKVVLPIIGPLAQQQA